MADPRFKRGAKLSPRHKLMGIHPHVLRAGVPAQFAVVPPQLSMWLNDQEGDCVTAEEAFAKAAFSVQLGLPELFVPDAEVQRWAQKYGFANGANLTDVMDQMATDGLEVSGTNEKDGPYTGVDWSNEAVLQSAIFTGPVKFALDANALPNDAGNSNGWFSDDAGPFNNTDHCMAFCGYGPAAFCFAQLNVPIPSGLNPTTMCYMPFTWSTIGVVTHRWIMGTVQEAYVRNPTTTGQGPPPPPPPGPGPTGLFALTTKPDGSLLFTPQVGGPIQITPQTTVADLIAAMGTGKTIVLPPFILKILGFVCPFASLIPAPIGPILVAVCAMIPHAVLNADGSKTILVPDNLRKQIAFLKGISRTTLPASLTSDQLAAVVQLENFFRGQ